MYASACSRNLTLGAPCCQRMPRVHRTFALRAETSDGGELRDMAADMLGKDPEVRSSNRSRSCFVGSRFDCNELYSLSSSTIFA